MILVTAAHFLGVLTEKNKKQRKSRKLVKSLFWDIFILKTISFILENMFRSLHTSSLVVHIKSTVNVQTIKRFVTMLEYR